MLKTLSLVSYLKVQMIHECTRTTGEHVTTRLYIWDHLRLKVQHNETYDLTQEGLVATITFRWNYDGSPDTVEVVPPDGYVSVPPYASVAEGTIQEFHIFKFQGM